MSCTFRLPSFFTCENHKLWVLKCSMAAGEVLPCGHHLATASSGLQPNSLGSHVNLDAFLQFI